MLELFPHSNCVKSFQPFLDCMSGFKYSHQGDFMSTAFSNVLGKSTINECACACIEFTSCVAYSFDANGQECVIQICLRYVLDMMKKLTLEKT